MKKKFHHLKRLLSNKNDGRNFLHFLLAFTAVFVALTVIILQVMTVGLYNSTDQNLRNLSHNQNFLESTIYSQLTNNAQNLNSPPPQGIRGDYGPNNSILLYDVKGNLISQAPKDTTNIGTANFVIKQLQEAVKFDKNDIGTIRAVSVENPYGADWHYRYMSVALQTSGETPNGSATQVAYIQLFSNVDQLQDSLNRITIIVIVTMVIFWLISIIISMYLARLSLRPIEKSYEKQKAFVENASHELRTPLAILQNRLELLFQNPTATIIDEAENISGSLEEVRNMRILTTNLLNLARRDNGIKIEPVTTDKAFFDGIFANYQILAEDAGKTLKTAIELEGSVKLDQNLIKQLLTIFFDNAMKYTADDGKIEIGVQMSGQHLLLSVIDNGEGISDEDKKHIFDRFYRVDKARTRQKGGLGLGLSLAKQIVDSYNGKITVENAYPKGTQFLVRIKIDNQSVKSAKKS